MPRAEKRKYDYESRLIRQNEEIAAENGLLRAKLRMVQLELRDIQPGMQRKIRNQSRRISSLENRVAELKVINTELNSQRRISSGGRRLTPPTVPPARVPNGLETLGPRPEHNHAPEHVCGSNCPVYLDRIAHATS